MTKPEENGLDVPFSEPTKIDWKERNAVDRIRIELSAKASLRSSASAARARSKAAHDTRAYFDPSGEVKE